MRRMRQIRNNRVTPKNNGKEGLSISGNADFGNGLGLGVENGRNGTTGSLTILGSQQGTVDVNGNYTANENFLGEINGQDMADLADTVERRRLAEENERNPAKNAKDAKDAPTKQPEEGPSGLVDVGAALLASGFAWAAAKLAGGGSSSSSPRAPAGNTANAETPVVGRKPRDEDEKDGKVKGEGDTKDEPPKKQPTQAELDNFKNNVFLNTTRAATDAYLDKLDKQGIDTKEMRAHAEAQRANGVRDLTAGEIQAKREKAAIAAYNRDGFFLDSNTGNFYVKQPDGGTKLFTKDEDGKDIIIVKDKDGKIKDRREYGVDVTDAIDLAKKPRQEAKIELVQATNAQKTNSTIPTEYKAKYSDDSEGGRLTRYSKAEGAEAKKAIDDKIRKEKGIEPNLNDARYWKAFIEEASKGKVKVFDKNNPMKIENGEGKQLFFIKDGIEGFLPSKQKVDNEFSGQKDQKNKSKVETKIITTDFSDGDNIKLVNKLSNNQLEPFNYKGNDALVIFDKDGKLLVTLPILTKNPTTLNDPGDEYPWDNKLVKAPTPQGYDYKGFTILDVPANREINGNPDPNTQVIGNMDYVPTDEDKDKVVDIHGFLGTHGCKQISPLNQAGIKNPNSDEISIVYDAFKHKELPAFAKAREHKKNNPKAENWILGTIRKINFPDKNSVKGKKK